LYYKDIFASDAFANLDSGLADAEFGEVNLGWWDTEVNTDLFGELRVRGSREEEDVADHRHGFGGGFDWLGGFCNGTLGMLRNA
jgi:hypothetical protein